MTTISFADVVHQSVTFSKDIPRDALILKLLDTSWVQRLRDLSQTANTRLVFMFSEHSRFGHSVGVAFLATLLMEKLKKRHKDEVEMYESAVAAAALLHDIGHLAPGSHTAFKTWYPHEEDTHEELSQIIIREDPEIQSILGSKLSETVCKILSEDPSLPSWTWEILSGGGWNVDRGNWCVVDSILAGVRYGEYNIPALLDSLIITDEGHIALQENRLDAMMHFAVSRHAMYKQIYQHRVILASDVVNQAIAQRARDLLTEGKANIFFHDEVMHKVLNSKNPQLLSLQDLFFIREPWWRYHILQWMNSSDSILSDLCSRLVNRKLFKTIRLSLNNISDIEKAKEALEKRGLIPSYYLHVIETAPIHSGDSRQSLIVQYDDGQQRTLSEADPLFQSLLLSGAGNQKKWLVVPGEIKEELGRER